MSKVLKVIGVIAGAVAVIATAGAVLFPGAAIFGVGLGTIGAIAGLVAGIASFGSQLLTKPPPARGSVTQTLIGPDAPQPYLIGEGYYAGVRRHDTAWGATLNKVPNPYRFMADVYSGGGPVQSITPTVDKLAVDAWYSTFLFTDTQLGACPEGTSLAPQWASTPGWGAASKLSGQAAIGWSLLFDKDGKRFASGVPQLGALGQWVKVYDPRLDGTRAGGVGAHRVDDEATWTWSENPALHAATYAYGRHQNGSRTFGIGLPDDAIDWGNVSAWAEVCEANGWTAFGVLYEPGDRWQNLADVASAGGAVPILGADGLRFHYAAPRVALDTITAADLAEEDQSVGAMAAWRDRLNTLIPKYRSEDHDWEMVAADAVEVATYVTEDGETKQAEWPCNLVKSADQAAQICAYRLVDGRELQPIELVCGPRLRAYRPGDCLTLDLPELGLETDAVILKRRFDPARLSVTLTLIGETPAKHAYALGLSGTAPPTPALGQSGEDRDELASAAALTDQLAVTMATDKLVAADYTGAVAGGNLSALVWSPSVLRGGTSIKLADSTTYALSNTYGGAFAVDNTNGSGTKGDITISAITANVAGGELVVTVDGIAQPRILFRVDKDIAAAPGASGKVATWVSGEMVGLDTTSETTIFTSLKPVTLAGGETLYGLAPLDYLVSGTTPASRTMTMKWQYSVAGAGVWTDFAAGITGSAGASGKTVGGEWIDPVPGSVAVTQSKGGLGAGSYDTRIVAVCSTTGRVCTPSGSAVMEAKV